MPATLTIAPKIQFYFLERGLTLSDRSHLKAFIASLFKKEKKKLTEIRYIFCSDDYLLEINRQYLQHDFYTDIITFGLSEPGEPINAEIYISVDRVRDNARQFSSSLKRELHRVIFHGALHLCGYGDKKKKEELLMRKMEDKYLGLYFKGR
jgi:probable rRNA maturation factor